VVEAGADAAPMVRPDPEVVAKAKRRKFTAQYKQQILAKADAAAADPGAIGALLRHESLYSSHLVMWRRQREASIRQGLAPQKRGPKVDEQARRLVQLEREKTRLQAKLDKAELIIDAQKKLLQVLGLPEPELPETNETA